MRYSYLLLFFLVILNSCKEKSSNSSIEKKAPIDSVETPIAPDNDSVKTSKNKIDFIIQRHTSKEATILPIGDPTVREIKSATDTLNIYGKILNKINKSIKGLNFKDSGVGNTESLMNFIEESKDSLNITLNNDFYTSNQILKFFEKSDYYFYLDTNIKIFFLKTKYHSKYDNDKLIENIYLISLKDDKITDILNIYYLAVRTHSKLSRFFYIDEDAKITTAIYTNIEGEISVSNYKKFVIDENGFFREE